MHCNTKVYAQALNFDHVCTYSVIVFSLSVKLCAQVYYHSNFAPSESDVWSYQFNFQGSVLFMCFDPI